MFLELNCHTSTELQCTISKFKNNRKEKLPQFINMSPPEVLHIKERNSVIVCTEMMQR